MIYLQKSQILSTTRFKLNIWKGRFKLYSILTVYFNCLFLVLCVCTNTVYHNDAINVICKNSIYLIRISKAQKKIKAFKFDGIRIATYLNWININLRHDNKILNVLLMVLTKYLNYQKLSEIINRRGGNIKLSQVQQKEQVVLVFMFSAIFGKVTFDVFKFQHF